MMEDLFEHEQRVLDDALAYLAAMEAGTCCTKERYAHIIKEYGRLLRQIRRITWISDRTAEELNASKQNLMEQINLDALTGLYNRSFLDKALSKMAQDKHIAGQSLSLLMIDVDFFKRYNDTYGHGMGDECLHAVAASLRESVPEGGFAARYGGEEFVIVLPGAEGAEAKAAAEAVLKQVRACGIEHKGNDAAPCVTVSVGASTGRVGARPLQDFLELADRAMYRAKQTGRNRYTFVDLEEE